MTKLMTSLALACLTAMPAALAVAQSDGASGGVISSDNSPKKVDDNRLNIRDKNLGEASENVKPSPQHDKEITRAIRASFAKDAAYKAVKVATLSGVVELGGSVKTQALKDSAESTAKATSGVVKVKNEIVVR